MSKGNKIDNNNNAADDNNIDDVICGSAAGLSQSIVWGTHSGKTPAGSITADDGDDDDYDDNNNNDADNDDEEYEVKIHYALMNAEAKIDRNYPVKSSRRLFYRRASSDEELNESLRFISRSIASHRRRSIIKTRRNRKNNKTKKNTKNPPLPSMQEDAEEEEEQQQQQQVDSKNNKMSALYNGVDDSLALEVGQEELTEFFLSQKNIDILQHDLEEAEKLFFDQYPGFARGRADISDALTATLPPDTYKIQLFNQELYHSQVHVWVDKPFVVEHMMTFFGTIRQERLDQVVQATWAEIVMANPDSWDKEGLVLCQVGRLFGCKLYLSVNEGEEQSLLKGSLLVTNNSMGTVPSLCKVEYISGTFLSLVYEGKYAEFSNWVEHAILHVRTKYKKVVKPHQAGHWFAYYPSKQIVKDEKELDEECVVVFFIKVKEFTEGEHMAV